MSQARNMGVTEVKPVFTDRTLEEIKEIYKVPMRYTINHGISDIAVVEPTGDFRDGKLTLKANKSEGELRRILNALEVLYNSGFKTAVDGTNYNYDFYGIIIKLIEVQYNTADPINTLKVVDGEEVTDDTVVNFSLNVKKAIVTALLEKYKVLVKSVDIDKVMSEGLIGADNIGDIIDSVLKFVKELLSPSGQPDATYPLIAVDLGVSDNIQKLAIYYTPSINFTYHTDSNDGYRKITGVSKDYSYDDAVDLMKLCDSEEIEIYIGYDLGDLGDIYSDYVTLITKTLVESDTYTSKFKLNKITYMWTYDETRVYKL